MTAHVIGDPGIFAVGLTFLDERDRRLLPGRFCYWIGGRRVGDFDQTIELADLLHGLKWIVWDNGKRNAASFRACSAETLFRAVDVRLFGPDLGDGTATIFGDDLQVAAFNLTLSCDALRAWKVFLFDFGDHSRIVWHHEETAETGELAVPSGACDAVVAETYRLILAKADGAVP